MFSDSPLQWPHYEESEDDEDDEDAFEDEDDGPPGSFGSFILFNDVPLLWIHSDGKLLRDV